MVQPDRGHEESALGVFLVSDGVDRCLIGFLPRQLIRDSEKFNNRIAQVVANLEVSENNADRARSKRNKGVVRAALLN